MDKISGDMGITPASVTGSDMSGGGYDYLTGLPTMGRFFLLAREGRRRMREEGIPSVVLFIDLNGMKHYNHRFGFAEGDRMISLFGGLLAEHFGKERTSRFGQDHFTAFTEAAGLEERLEALFLALRSLKLKRPLTIRVGIYPDGDEEAEVSLACDRAKMACDLDRNRYGSHYRYFNDSMLAETERKQYIIDNLDRAIEEGWIEVYFHPIIRSANGRVSDEEALARWNDPVNGMLSPAEFIPVLEEAKLIYRLDLCVLEQVLKKLKIQRKAGLYVVPQSINLSRTDFDSTDIVSEIVKRVDAAGVDRSKINIEITESVVGKDFSFMKEQILRFRELGFPVWMDDFGSGYSSLDVLQSVHFDLIKLDMRFMQRFEESEECRIILTELIRMAIGLGIDTVTEGVETKEQADFLKEIGCTKLQGFYYVKPIPLREILRRYESGIEIGFENPEEAGYYAALGRINLYDFSAVVSESPESFNQFFNATPMAVFETSGDTTVIVRCNRPYREFLRRCFHADEVDERMDVRRLGATKSVSFMKSLAECIETGTYRISDDLLSTGFVVHSYIRRIAVNPVNGTVACATVVLGVTDNETRGRGLTYAYMAKMLSLDYFNLYYINVETEDFIEYRPDPDEGKLYVVRYGTSFFGKSREDAIDHIYSEDRQTFANAFTKEHLLEAIRSHGAFSLNYRLLIDGVPKYVNLKAVLAEENDSHIIIGVNDVNAQMEQQKILERIQEERITYARIMALSGDYICIYTVNLETDVYREYLVTEEYEGLGLAKRGKDFFAESHGQSKGKIYDEDLEAFLENFTREKVLLAIARDGRFSWNYRIVLGGKVTSVCLKAAIVEEKDGPQLIVGIVNMDSQLKRDREFAEAAKRKREE